MGKISGNVIKASYFFVKLQNMYSRSPLFRTKVENDFLTFEKYSLS